MQFNEQSFDPDGVPRAVVAFGYDPMTNRMDRPVHRHRKAELILTMRGLVTCEVDHRVWLVPPRSAVWIPSGVVHTAKGSGGVQIVCFFVEPEGAPALPHECCTLSVSPLLQELLLHAADLPELYDLEGPPGRLVAVLLDQLAAAPIEPLSFPMPRDKRLRLIAEAMMAAPAERVTMADWGRRVGAAERTLTRVLYRETGMSFGRWRQQLHIVIALKWLAQGATVQTVAFDLGYEGASAFIAMFRKIFGKPPARYLADRR